MSESLPSPKKVSLLRPWTIILGFFAGLAFFAWLGHHSTSSDWHQNFTRFHPMIAPESMYQPTVDEMCAVVRARCHKGQILVIVGGNSILLGVGQPANEMWTRRLQAELGPRYAVVNLAFRGSSATDGGAIVAEVLRKEFPQQIYIANAAALQSVSPIGMPTYRFILLDAYYKKLLLPWGPREDALEDLRSKAADRAQFKESELGARLDAWLHFRDFWNHWSYTKFFTFPTTLMPDYPSAYYPRNRFTDDENDYETIPFEVRFSPEIIAADLNITQQLSKSFYTATADGGWQPIAWALDSVKNYIRTAFPDELHKRTLILIGRSSSFYTARLDKNITARDDIAYRDTVAAWTTAGYHSIEYGKDFRPEDYGDRSHLTTHGGQKLAAIVAPQVESMAQELGYLHP